MGVGGAQALSQAGLDAWAIALLVVWGRSVVFWYVRDAPLGSSAALQGSPSHGGKGPAAAIGQPKVAPPRQAAPRCSEAAADRSAGGLAGDFIDQDIQIAQEIANQRNFHLGTFDQ